MLGLLSVWGCCISVRSGLRAEAGGLGVGDPVGGVHYLSGPSSKQVGHVGPALVLRCSSSEQPHGPNHRISVHFLNI